MGGSTLNQVVDPLIPRAPVVPSFGRWDWRPGCQADPVIPNLRFGTTGALGISCFVKKNIQHMCSGFSLKFVEG